MPIRISEAVAAFQHTPISQCFIAVLQDLSAYIEAERDLEHAGAFDLAFDGWFVDAERAREQVLGDLCDLQRAGVSRREDLPLKRIGVLTRLLIESDTPTRFAQLFSSMQQRADLFSCPGQGLIPSRINLMIDATRLRLNDLARLSEHID
ncbi:MAG: hypothetical protein CFE33_19875, partial [Pseudorhodobacter sp. PARRP1]